MKYLITYLVLALIQNSLYGQTLLRANEKRIQERIQTLAQYGANPEGGVSRVAFSPADIEGREYIIGLMKSVGLKVSIDPAGNIIGKRKGTKGSLPSIAFGSHIDSVPKGGNYDGNAGVISALECIELLNENNITTRHPLEVIVFSDEEGGLTGSQAIIGTLDSEDLKRVSNSGKTIREGISDIGGNPEKLEEAKRQKGEMKAFLELHIEQGAILDQEKIQIGVVEGIVGIEWWDIIVSGKANHAGTTPMNLRHDAMLSASYMAIAVNEVAKKTPGRQVATVGRINAEPGAPNVIPGRVVMSLEIRDLSRDKIFSVFEKIKERAPEIEQNTGTKIEFVSKNVDIIPAIANEQIQQLISESSKELGYSFKKMPSGAGHDAQDMAKIAPMGMIFVPSLGGISHSPKEFTSAEDMANGASVLLRTILKIDSTSL